MGQMTQRDFSSLIMILWCYFGFFVLNWSCALPSNSLRTTEKWSKKRENLVLLWR